MTCWTQSPDAPPPLLNRCSLACSKFLFNIEHIACPNCTKLDRSTPLGPRLNTRQMWSGSDQWFSGYETSGKTESCIIGCELWIHGSIVEVLIVACSGWNGSSPQAVTVVSMMCRVSLSLKHERSTMNLCFYLWFKHTIQTRVPFQPLRPWNRSRSAQSTHFNYEPCCLQRSGLCGMKVCSKRSK